jgi:hypothetical protein
LVEGVFRVSPTPCDAKKPTRILLFHRRPFREPHE